MNEPSDQRPLSLCTTEHLDYQCKFVSYALPRWNPWYVCGWASWFEKMVFYIHSNVMDAHKRHIIL